jgi:quercetin dioxygenase-like cupin family protein
MLHVLNGVLTVNVDQARHHARTGETVVFSADRPHEYANERDRPLRFVMVVLEPRPPAPAPAVKLATRRARRQGR